MGRWGRSRRSRSSLDNGIVLVAYRADRDRQGGQRDRHQAGAAVLSIEAAAGPAGRDRDTLPHACKAWGINLVGHKVGEQELWPTDGRMWGVRHGFVHRGEQVSAEDASLAMACTRALIEGPMTALVIRLELRSPEGPWLLDWDEARDPFDKKR